MHSNNHLDMETWIDHGEIFNSSDVGWGLPGWMWAPSVARKDGTYYLYFPHKYDEDNWRIGVATAPSPTGPFKEVPGYMEGIWGIDPMVFIDDDGEAFMYTAAFEPLVVKLKPNMIEVAETPREIVYKTAPEVQQNHDLQFEEGKRYFLVRERRLYNELY